MLGWHAQRHPERIAIRLCEDEVWTPISYAELYRDACALAAGLRRRGLRPGQTVAIMLATERGYFASFFGILLAGATPVPIYPPARSNQIEEHLRRHAKILANAGCALLITVPEAKFVGALLRAQVPTLEGVVGVAELLDPDDGGAERFLPPVRADDLAFVQYTSGSTGDPKGVMLSHANLIANIRAMARRLDAGDDDVFVSWLPLYHDMGLIGACLGSLYQGIPLAVMSPLRFLRRPDRWLWAIHEHRGTLSAGPNFAYELCLKQTDDAAFEGLDLSCWRVAANGAEPVIPDTLRRFAGRFSRYGFDPAALAPVYGLAESSVGLALPVPGRGLKTDPVSRDRLARSGVAAPVPAGAEPASVVEIPACGHALEGHQIRIVDDAGRELPERREGRLQFRGPSSTRGYLRNANATAALFDGVWLNSGDRGYVVAGDVYLTGRDKDMIIRGGRNIYPYELEQAVATLDGVRKGCVAVFASPDPDSGSEKLVVVAETRLPVSAERDRSVLHARIRAVTVDLLGAPADDVVLAAPYAVLKTSSGKVRRAATAERYRAGTLGRDGGALSQLARLGATGLWPNLRRLARAAGEGLYALYALLLTLLLALPLITIALLPGIRVRWQLAGALVRLTLRLLGMRLRRDGLTRLPEGPYVLVANHASYLDALVLIAALPQPLRFVAKRELAGVAALRWLLTRIGTLFVERFDQRRAGADADRLLNAARAGDRLALFPEGTFSRAPGLLPFRSGAFVVAAAAGLPLVPVALRGTRSLLRAGSWRLRRTALSVQICAPVPAGGASVATDAAAVWPQAVRLQRAARAALLAATGEPELGRDDSPLTAPDPTIALTDRNSG